MNELERGQLEAMRGQGFERVEIWGMAPHFDARDDARVELLDAWLSEMDMVAATYHAPFYNRFGSPDFKLYSLATEDQALLRESIDATRRAIEVAGFLGSDLVVVHGPGGVDDSGPECVRHFIESLAELSQVAQRVGVRIGVENVITDESRAERLVELIEDLGAGNVGLCLDLGHLNVEQDLLSGLEAGSDLLLSVHISDNHGERDEHLIPGRGNIDWGEASDKLGSMPRLAHMVLEVMSHNAGAPVEDPLVQQSLQALEQCWRRFFTETK